MSSSAVRGRSQVTRAGTALIEEVTRNRLQRPNRPAGYTKSDVKRFRNSLKLAGKAELFVGHTA